MSTIHVEELEIFTIIGIKQEERDNKQKLLIDYWLEVDISRPMISDEIDDCVNYRSINKDVLFAVEKSTYNTIERLMNDLLEIILGFDGVLHAKVRIAKPGALRYSKNVSITTERLAP